MDQKLRDILAPTDVWKEIIKGITNWIGEQEQDLQEVVREQNTGVGWDQLIRGQVLHTWDSLVWMRRKNNPKDKFIARDTTDQWATKLGAIVMLNFMVHVWINRNAALAHGSTRLEKQQATRQKAIARVLQLYYRKPQLRTTDENRYFRLSLHDLESKPTPNLLAWATLVEIAEESYSKWYGEIHLNKTNDTVRMD